MSSAVQCLISGELLTRRRQQIYGDVHITAWFVLNASPLLVSTDIVMVSKWHIKIKKQYFRVCEISYIYFEFFPAEDPLASSLTLANRLYEPLPPDMDLDVRHYLTKAKEQQDSAAVRAAYKLIEATTAAGTGGRMRRIAPELYVDCAEAALQLGCLEISTACLKMYFEGNPPSNQFLCRAYLCQGQLTSPPANGSVEDFEEAVVYFLKAIEISKLESRRGYSFKFEQLSDSISEQGKTGDKYWHLIKCLIESKKMEEAAELAKVTGELIKSHSPHLYPRFFMLLVQHSLTEGDVLIEMSRQSYTLAVIYKIQEFKKLEENKDGLTKEDSTKLEEIFHLLVDCTDASAVPANLSPPQSPIQPADRVAFLLELALLALQVKHQRVAADCLKELKLAREASIGQRIIMECVNSEINLLEKEAKMNDYSKARVEVLDHTLLQEMRCQVHSELAVIEEEEGRLEASLTHLQKAMLLDNGTQGERLSSALRLLQLRATLYQTPSRAEDKAAKLMQQVFSSSSSNVHAVYSFNETGVTHVIGMPKSASNSILLLHGAVEARDMSPQDKTDIRPILVAVGLLLGPDDFQIVMDGDNISKIAEDSLGSGPVAHLSAKAQHHSASLQKVDGHLGRRAGDTDNTERMKLWATLAKTARKREVWDVCRAACRFCLLYDNGGWKISKADKFSCSDEENEECLDGCNESQTSVRDHLRLLAEIHFISAEATVLKLLTEGVQLNSPAVPPREGGVHVSDDDPHWIIFRDWVHALSAYATSSFLRAAELGSEIMEPWVVANAAIYLWNYSSHLLAAGEYQRLLPPFQSLVEMLRKIECPGNPTLVVLLCNAVAWGLIQPVMEKDPSVQGVALEAALQDVRKALELCDYALHISNCNIPCETVPIAAKKQVVATWVQIKRLLQQQICSKIDIKDEIYGSKHRFSCKYFDVKPDRLYMYIQQSPALRGSVFYVLHVFLQCVNEEESTMTRVLVGVEMLQCNRNPSHMEITVPSLSALVSMASECSWTDAVVELQVWCQLAAFCHYAKDHSLVLCYTKRALQLEEAAAKSINTMPCLFYAEKAENPALCVRAARHYWNTCLPLSQTPEERWQLRDPLEKILKALVHTTTKRRKKQAAVKGTLPLGSSKLEATADEEDLTLSAGIYTLLLHIHVDKCDWKSALQLMDKAQRDMPRTRHRLPLLKYRILVKAKVGESVLMDIQKLQDEGEQCCSLMWHQVALRAGNITQQLTCYKKSITSLLSTEAQWQKVNLVLEFGQWLYCHNFPKASAQHLVQWAIDILLHLEPEEAEGAEDESKKRGSRTDEQESLVGVQGSLFIQNLSNLKEVRRLDGLVRAHTLLAVMADRTSPEHELNLLKAYTFVLQIWQVSMAVALEGPSEIVMALPLRPPSTASKKGKGKSRKDVKENSEDLLSAEFGDTVSGESLGIVPNPGRRADEEFGDQKAMARSLLSQATLACEEQNHAQALILLDKARGLSGGEEFWYQLTLTKVRAVVGQRHQDAQAKADQIIKQGCGALKLVLEQQVNRVPELTFLITSLEMRILANHTNHKEDKQRLLLDGLSQLQLAVTVQERVVLNAQSLLPPQEVTHGISLPAKRRLLRLRLLLARFCLAVLEELCAEEKCQALSRETKNSSEIALEEFARCTPEPNSIEQEWVSVGSTVGQVALGQLAAVSSHSLDNMETRARYLGLMGKYLRLLAVQEDPLYLCALWDKHKHEEAWSDPRTISVEENSEKDRESSRKERRMISAKTVELQSCCTVAVMAKVLNSACTDTSVSQLSALLSLHRKLLLSQEERPSSMLKGAEDSLNSFSKAFSQLTINPNHLNILAELPSNLKILLLQHSEDGSELYGGFYEMTKAPENQKGKTPQVTATLTCSRVAKVSACPQALLALREQFLAFAEGRVETPEKRQAVPCKTAGDEKLAPHFNKIVQDMEDYLNPLLTQFDSCLRLQCAPVPFPEMTNPKHNEEKVSSPNLPTEPGEYVVLLADRKLLELPLESLSILRQEGLSSVSRDFSVQLLHSRLNQLQPEKDCQIALLFEQLQNNAGILRQSILDTHKIAGQFALQKPLETALLLSLGGVGCVVLNQWHSSLQQNTHNMATVLDSEYALQTKTQANVRPPSIHTTNWLVVPHWKISIMRLW
ncbi:hypothetical protein F2P81_019926 [Scophthalmus maximus]|uniref:Cilia-and flagella-associated protein 46 n=1 Tax=Scophthalmus maximus TaxID=52904 RepID=A0A6A4S4K7_SCOMX|nr:hypothetical protein F2P81_019926 [Scophthalmus maximus]